MQNRILCLLLGMLLALAGCGASTMSTNERDGTALAGAKTRAATLTVQPSPAPTTTAADRPSPGGAPPQGLLRPATWPAARALAAQVDPERLMADVRWLADDARGGRKAGTDDEDVVRDWLVERFQGLGLEAFAALGLAGYTQPFNLATESSTPEPVVADNVVALLPGAVYPDRYVYLTAHYDHLGAIPGGLVFNGADDNATGVAAVLEAARILSAADPPPEETLVFVAFSAEEMGLLGADTLCGALQAAGLAGSSQVLNLDVLGASAGAPNSVDIWDEESSSTEPLVQALQAAAEGLAVPTERRVGDPGSDARRLVGCGVPAASVSVAWSSETHLCIHQPCDDWWLIDVDGFANAARVAVAAAWLLANDGR